MDIDEAGPDNEEGQINSKKLERSLDTIVQNQNDFYDKENKNNYNLNSNNINNSNNKNKKFMASSAIITSSFRNENINLDHQKINKLESINTFNCKKFEVKNINAVNNWTLNNIANFENIESFNFIRNLHNLNQINLSKRAPVLPKKTRSSHPITLVLDLDETLVHCSTTQMDSPDLEFNVNFNGVDYLVKGKVRPYYKEFLERASEMFEIVIFTASQKVYADSLLNILDPNRKLIRHRLFRDSCSHIYGNYLKDLSILGRDLSKCVIVDNSPQAFGFHLPNGIPISSWYEDKEDTELLKLLHFLEKIREAEDVRPFVVNEFRMEERIFG
ncbi:CTD small phosphatase-like protein 2 [Clydaea vesicula]|uniref:CTD small phosphatase-like protein 2 n=1 Tax=Clydaea vesicula TaxID=447962 RepID=A0AAD5TTA3_9FUNG|nr:CTD small phosphatase-like protein 2 [Clydaea vesicula]